MSWCSSWWLADGHIAMVSPGDFARLIPVGHRI
jgi:hypothetical protein